MLPQFGYIVAQAGADSHTLPPPTNASLAPLLNKSFQYGFNTNTNINTRETNNYYNSYNTPPPPPPPPSAPVQAPFYTRPPSPSAVAPVLPPPKPYVYSTEKVEPKMSLVDKTIYSDEEPEQTKEYNDLMTWMDNEFWERTDEIYKEKMQNLKLELESIIEGTHSVFKEILEDYEFIREKTVDDADCFLKYQLELIGQFYDSDVKIVQEEYEVEKKHLHDSLLISIEDQRKQIKEDEHEGEEVRVKRNLRKRNADAAGLKTEPLSKRRSARPSTLPNIHVISATEEEELEEEFMNMKSLASKQ